MSVQRVLLIGSNGLLGQKLAELLVRGTTYRVTLASRENRSARPLASTEHMQIDITSKKDVKRVVFSCEPDVIINAAGMTDVDACEKERELAWKVNVEGVKNIVDAARKNDARIIHVSSDYIFNGKSGPYTEEERPEPINYYGKTKLASENALKASGLAYLIARTIVLYGFTADTRPNFALWLIQNLERKLPVRLVIDQYGNPTLADDLAYGIVRGMELNRAGVYNIAGRDIVNRHEFGVKLARTFDFDPGLIVPIKTSQLRQAAARPLKSGLVTLKAEVELGISPSTVEQGLAVLKNQLSRNSKMLADSAPVPGSPASRHAKR